jgi:hypothetical protein
VYPLKYLTSHVRWLAGDFVDAKRLHLLLKTEPSIANEPRAYPLAVCDEEVQLAYVLEIKYIYNTYTRYVFKSWNFKCLDTFFLFKGYIKGLTT